MLNWSRAAIVGLLERALRSWLGADRPRLLLTVLLVLAVETENMEPGEGARWLSLSVPPLRSLRLPRAD
jgi:hypothetical protein